MSIQPGSTREAGSHPQAVMAVYLGEADIGTAYFSPPLVPEGFWNADMKPDIPDQFVNSCGLTSEGNLYCGDYRVLDARASISENAPDVVQRVRILALSPEIPNDTMSFSSEFSEELKQIIIDGMIAYLGTEACAKTICNEKFYDWTGAGPIYDENFDGVRILMEYININLNNIGD